VTAGRSNARGQPLADLRRGWSVPLADLVIAALVVLPFTGGLAILVGWMFPLSSAVLIVLTGLLQGVAMFWNAGWRARTSE
jgi:hypothetical protein